MAKRRKYRVGEMAAFYFLGGARIGRIQAIHRVVSGIAIKKVAVMELAYTDYEKKFCTALVSMPYEALGKVGE